MRLNPTLDQLGLNIDGDIDDPTETMNMDLFIGQPDSTCEYCDEPTDGQVMCSINDNSSAPEMISHLIHYINAPR